MAQLFVGQLPFNKFFPEDLERIFAPYGTVVGRELYVRKGNGFVLYRTTDEADAAITALHGRYYVEGGRHQPIQVMYSRGSRLISEFGLRHRALCMSARGGHGGDARVAPTVDDDAGKESLSSGRLSTMAKTNVKLAEETSKPPAASSPSPAPGQLRYPECVPYHLTSTAVSRPPVPHWQRHDQPSPSCPSAQPLNRLVVIASGGSQEPAVTRNSVTTNATANHSSAIELAPIAAEVHDNTRNAHLWTQAVGHSPLTEKSRGDGSAESYHAVFGPPLTHTLAGNAQSASSGFASLSPSGPLGALATSPTSVATSDVYGSALMSAAYISVSNSGTHPHAQPCLVQYVVYPNMAVTNSSATVGGSTSVMSPVMNSTSTSGGVWVIQGTNAIGPSTTYNRENTHLSLNSQPYFSPCQLSQSATPAGLSAVMQTHNPSITVSGDHLSHASMISPGRWASTSAAPRESPQSHVFSAHANRHYVVQ